MILCVLHVFLFQLEPELLFVLFILLKFILVDLHSIDILLQDTFIFNVALNSGEVVLKQFF